jgi:hypothetical protein
MSDNALFNSIREITRQSESNEAPNSLSMGRVYSLQRWPQSGLQHTKNRAIPSSPLAVACKLYKHVADRCNKWIRVQASWEVGQGSHDKCKLGGQDCHHIHIRTTSIGQKENDVLPGRKQPLHDHTLHSGQSWFLEELGRKLHPAEPACAPQQSGAPRSGTRSCCQRSPGWNKDEKNLAGGLGPILR